MRVRAEPAEGPVGAAPPLGQAAEDAARLFAADPHGLGGVCLRAAPGPARDAWIAHLRHLLRPAAAFRRLPAATGDDRLLGGLDLAATLAAGRPVVGRGLLAEADGGVLVLPMAERTAPGLAARVGAALDAGFVATERDGRSATLPARFGVVALDEGEADERPPAGLLDRLAFHLDLDGLRPDEIAPGHGLETPGGEVSLPAPPEPAAACTAASVPDAIIAALCQAAAALGVASPRASLFAVRAARAAAGLAGRTEADAADAALAARLVLAPRATRLPPAEPDAPPEPPPPNPGDTPDASEAEPEGGPLADRVLQAAKAAIPPGVLAALAQAAASRPRSSGGAGAMQRAALRGRPAGSRRGDPRGGARLDLIATLRAAAPWQRLRRRPENGALGPELSSGGQGAALDPLGPEAPDPRSGKRGLATGPRRGAGAERVEVPIGPLPSIGSLAQGEPLALRPLRRVEVRRDDFRIVRFRRRAARTAIFAVDASGSAALHRLAEAKGAVELLLADCYVRRDRVAVIAFRGRGAELLLPPTASLVRARRSLAGLPGGGGTPLAAGIAAAAALADAVQRQGQTPLVVLLTDGRGNIAADGTADRARAETDALAAGRRMREAGIAAVLLDIAPRPQPAAARLAQAMGAQYRPLPQADAQHLSAAVQASLAATPAPVRTRL